MNSEINNQGVNNIPVQEGSVSGVTNNVIPVQAVPEQNATPNISSNVDAQAQAAQGMAPTQPVQPQPAAPALATEQTQAEPGLVIEEPSLNNIEPASQELNLDASVQEEQESIFGTPEMQAPAAVETTAPDPATVEGPTLVIEDKEEVTTPEMTAPTVEPAAPTPTETVVPEVTPTTPVAAPVVEPVTQEAAPVAPTMTAPEMPTAPTAAPTTPETPIQQ